LVVSNFVARIGEAKKTPFSSVNSTSKTTSAGKSVYVKLTKYSLKGVFPTISPAQIFITSNLLGDITCAEDLETVNKNTPKKSENFIRERVVFFII
jgi:hypothetical protein